MGGGGRTKEGKKKGGREGEEEVNQNTMPSRGMQQLFSKE